MKKNVLTLFLVAMFLTAIPGVIVAQPEIEWRRNYGGEDEDNCRNIIQTTDGGFLLVGRNESFGEVDWDAWILKTDADGDSLWSREYGGDEEDCFTHVIELEDDNYILAGYTNSEENNNQDLWLMRIDADREIVWSHTYGGRYAEFPVSIQQTDDGGYIFGSFSYSFGWDGSIYVVKVDDEGEEEWANSYGGNERDDCGTVIQTAAGEFLIVGSTESFGVDRRDAYVILIDDDGEVIWDQTYGGRQIDSFSGGIQLEDGSFRFVGATSSFGHDNNYAWLAQTDGEGEDLQNLFFDERLIFKDIFLMEDEGFLMLCISNWDAILRTDAEGEELWRVEHGGGYYLSGDQTEDGGFAFGYTSGENRGNFAMTKLSPDPQLGVPGWQPLEGIELDEDNVVELEIEFLFDHIEDINDPDSTLEITVENGENVFAHFEDDMLIIIPKLDWWGSDNIRLIVTDPDDHSAETDLQLTVLSVNDPPDPFALSLPENGWEVNARSVAFIWDVAEQNEFEIDDVQYNLLFTFEDEQYEITEIHGVVYILDDIGILVESLGITDEGEDIEITWTVTAADDESETVCIEPFVFILPTLGIGNPDDALNPLTFSLSSAYPNPFNAVTQINFSLAKGGYASLMILDLTGHEVATLISRQVEAGRYTAVWNADRQAAGMYFYRLRSGDFQQTKKLMLIK